MVLYTQQYCMKHENAEYIQLQSQPPSAILHPSIPPILSTVRKFFGFSPWSRIGAGKNRMPFLLLINFFPLHLSGTAHRQEYIPVNIWTDVASSPQKPVPYSFKFACDIVLLYIACSWSNLISSTFLKDACDNIYPGVP